MDMEQFGKVYSTDVELWQQEVLVIIGYIKAILSMSDDFCTLEYCINRSK